MGHGESGREVHPTSDDLDIARRFPRGGLGELPEAPKTLAAAILSYDWKATRARDVYSWIRHVLRREAEGLIFRRGDNQSGA